MTKEQMKDIRLMLDMISKDLTRLSNDVKCLSQFLAPQSDPLDILPFKNCENCKHADDDLYDELCQSCIKFSNWEEPDNDS